MRLYAVPRRTRVEGGGGTDRVGPPTGWHRLRQIGDQLVSGVEQFLLIRAFFMTVWRLSTRSAENSCGIRQS